MRADRPTIEMPAYADQPAPADYVTARLASDATRLRLDSYRAANDTRKTAELPAVTLD